MLKIVRGPVGSGKSRYCREEIIKTLKEAPLGPAVFYLVPGSATFENEYLLNTREDLPGSFRLQVVNLQKLSLKVMREFKAELKNSSVFIYKLSLKKVLAEKKEELLVLKKAAAKGSFVEDLLSLFQEFRRYRVKPSDLLKASLTINDYPLHQKLLDLHLLYQLYLEKFGEEFTPEGILERLIEYSQKSKLLKGAKVFIDGFYTFTPLEVEVIKALLKTSAEVTITFPDEYEGKILSKITLAAKEQGLKVEEVFLKNYERFQTKELTHLAQNPYPYPTPAFLEETENISFISVANPLEEMEKAAQIIRHLCKEKGYKLADFLVLMPEDSYYQTNLKNVFAEYSLPVDVDQNLAFSHHQLYLLLRGLLGELNQERAIVSLKSGLLNLTPEESFLLENYLLSRGLDTRDFTDKKAWEQSYWTIWKKGFGEIISFTRELSSLKTYREFSQRLKEVLVKVGVPRKLAAEKGERFWKALINLLTEVEEAFGDEEVDPLSFAEELLTFLKNLSLKTVPLGLDQVRAGSIKKYWTSEARVVIILGAVEGSFPPKPAVGLIFTEEERTKLKNIGLELSPLLRQRLKENNYQVFLALTRAAERLFIFYPRVSLTGDSFSPALIKDWLKKAFPYLKEKEDKLLEATYHSLTRLISREMEVLKGEGLSLKAKGAFNALWQKRPELLEKIYRAFSLSPDRLCLTYRPEVALASKTLSVSRLEAYYSCPFKYFLQYLLNLKERELFDPEAADAGALLHYALALISQTVREQDKRLKDIEPSELKKIIVSSFNAAEKQYGEKFFKTSRNQYFLKRLYLYLEKAVEVLKYFDEYTCFTPYGEELTFGANGRLQSPEFTVKGEKFTLTGKIDRLDVFNTPEKTYVRVVDYKTGKKAVSLDEVLGGINLQLLTYLYIAGENKELFGNEVVPAGAFYFRLQNPAVKQEDKPLSLEEIWQKQLESFRYEGYSLEDEESLKYLDRLYPDKPQTINLGARKDGRYARTLTKTEMQAVFAKIEDLIKEAIFKISAGEFSAIPYQLKDATGCRYCPYFAVCRMEEGEKQYRVVLKKKDREILSLLAGGGGEVEELDL